MRYANSENQYFVQLLLCDTFNFPLYIKSRVIAQNYLHSVTLALLKIITQKFIQYHKCLQLFNEIQLTTENHLRTLT